MLLQDAAGFEVAELSDDHVRSENLRSGGTQEWREWEVELLGGAPDTRERRNALLDEIEERLLAAGARPSGELVEAAAGARALIPAVATTADSSRPVRFCAAARGRA